MAGQAIRRSQFITTYGPGAILEGAEGPRVIHTLENSGLFNGPARINDFEIVEPRLSQNLLGGAKIVALPSNAQIGREESAAIYDTSPFPKWSLCVRHSVLYRKRNNDNRACPQCAPLQSPQAAWRRAGTEKTRFIQVCPSGHMQDVDWNGLVSAMGGGCQGGCRPDYFLWEGGGGALRAVNIRCPNCGRAGNLGAAYSRTWRCSGAFPEEPSAPTISCPTPGSIVQRGAANVFVPETVSALTIPEAALVLHRLLGQRALLPVFTVLPPANFAALEAMLNQLTASGALSPHTAASILSHPPTEVMRALSEVMRPTRNQTETEMRLDEYHRLRDAAVEGFPREPGVSRPLFEVISGDVRQFPTPAGQTLRVTPVSRLRVVMVQKGYRRLDGTTVDRRAVIDGEHWYPGVELFGEGIFIDLVDGSGTVTQVPASGPAADSWRATFDLAQSGGPVPESTQENPLLAHPAFVWLHSLSHRLISALSLSCGYSAAALRERIFVEPTGNGVDAHGGILLYTVQPGGDGTLGGLVSLVNRFDEVIERAYRNIDACSNDPLCGLEGHDHQHANGAACYACLFQSETSCEHRNGSLDRHVLLTSHA